MALTVDRDFLKNALTWEQWLAGMTRNAERFMQNYEATEISPADREFFAGLPHPVDVVCIVADWCGDVIANFGMVGKLAEASAGKLRLHIFLRDDNEEFAAQYPSPDGRNHIPTYIFFDHQLNELGLFMERPTLVTEALQTWKADFAAAHPEYSGLHLPPSEMPEETRTAYRAYANRKRAELRAQEQEAIFAQFRDIVSRVPATI